MLRDLSIESDVLARRKQLEQLLDGTFDHVLNRFAS